jgi:hypothetical protein
LGARPVERRFGAWVKLAILNLDQTLERFCVLRKRGTDPSQ